MCCWGSISLSIQGEWSLSSDLKSWVQAELLCPSALGGQAGPTRRAQTTYLDQPFSS